MRDAFFVSSFSTHIVYLLFLISTKHPTVTWWNGSDFLSSVNFYLCPFQFVCKYCTIPWNLPTLTSRVAKCYLSESCYLYSRIHVAPYCIVLIYCRLFPTITCRNVEERLSVTWEPEIWLRSLFSNVVTHRYSQKCKQVFWGNCLLC